jgi:hypothetical protein
LEKKFPNFKEILENANMLCHDMQPDALLMWRGFINAKKWMLQAGGQTAMGAWSDRLSLLIS